MIGQLDIKKIRSTATKALGDKFDLRDFHYQVLSQGSSPLDYLTDHVNKYIACVLTPEKDGCDTILGRAKKSSAAKTSNLKRKSVPWPVVRPTKRHYV